MEKAKKQTFEYDGRIALLIPAYKPDGRLRETLEAVLEAWNGPIVVVDDGSGEAFAGIFSELEQLGAAVCRHPKNKGKGAALKTGLRYIAKYFEGCAGVVTADADGQHSPEDICRIAARVAEAPEALVLGMRDFTLENLPKASLFGNRLTSAVFRLVTGVSCPDTQTGLRGIPAALFPLALSAQGERYEYEMNFLLQAAEDKYPLEMLPIRTIYQEGNSSSHFRKVRDSIRIYRRPLTFLAGALTSSLVDLTAFYLLLRFAFSGNKDCLFFASALARLLSGCVNFILNKTLTFQSRGNTGRESVRYGCLFFGVLFLSSAGVSLLGRLPVPALLIKIVLDSALFLMNYMAQRKWVFRHETR